MAQYTPSSDFTISSAAYTPSADFDVQTATEVTAVADVALIRAALRQAGADLAVQLGGLTVSADADLALQQGGTVGADADLAVSLGRFLEADADMVASAARTLSADLDLWLIDASATVTVELEALADSVLFQSVQRSVGADLAVAIGRTRTTQAGMVLRAQRLRQVLADLDLMPGIQRQAIIAAASMCLELHRKLAVYPDVVLMRPTTRERALRARLDLNLLPGDDMALSFSTGLRNHLLGRYATETGDGLAGAMHNCFVDLYSGEKPVSPDSAPLHGTYLGTFQLSENPYNDEWGGAWSNPSFGRISKQSWQNWVMWAEASGQAGWFRMRLIGDLHDYSQTAHRIDGTVGSQYGAFDLVMKDANIVRGNRYRIEAFTMIMRQEN